MAAKTRRSINRTTRTPAKPAVAPKRKPARRPKAASSARPPKVLGTSTGLLGRLRAICLALPSTKEVEAWGHPTFRVGEKIFATFGADAGTARISVKTTHELQSALVASDPRFAIAAYVGKHGWVQMTLAAPVDWDEVEALVRESYRWIAPARLAAAVTTPPTRR
jgi:predicted DNA-binding protein (MmcQ/YjbR family)